MPRNNKLSVGGWRRDKAGSVSRVRLEGRAAGLLDWRKGKGEMEESSRTGEDLPLPTRSEAFSAI